MHAADLVGALRRRVDRLEMYGMGGPLMERAGVELLFNPTSMSTVGFVEALKNVQVMRRVLARLGKAMEQRPPDVAVCIDFSGFNMKLAEAGSTERRARRLLLAAFGVGLGQGPRGEAGAPGRHRLRGASFRRGSVQTGRCGREYSSAIRWWTE